MTDNMKPITIDMDRYERFQLENEEIRKRAIVKVWIADAVVKHIINNDKFKMEQEYIKILTEVMNDFHLKL